MKRTPPSLPAATLFACGLLACSLLTGCIASKANPDAISQQLAVALPLRSTPIQVLDYLTARKISHSPYRRDDTSGNKIEAELSVTSTHDLIDPSYSLTFRFDGHDLLTATDVEYLGYIGF